MTKAPTPDEDRLLMSPFPLASRLSAVRESPSMKAAQTARDLKAAGHDVIDLTLGEPDFDTPDHVKAAAIAAIRAGQTKYTPVNGTPALRSTIVAHTNTRTGHTYGLENVAVGGGAKQVIFLALMATVEAGTEVLVPSPYWVSYPDMVAAHGGRAVVVECGEENGFLLTADQLEAAITDRTRWLILNAPGNPSGALYSADRLAELAAVLRRHPQVLVLCDEIYDEIVYTDRPAPSLLTVAPDLADRVLLINGASKAYAMTGWRIGWGLGPVPLVDAINILQSQSSTCPSSISQAAVVAALTNDQGFVTTTRDAYRGRRDLLVAALDPIPGLTPVTPDGSFYCFVGCQGLIGRSTPQGDVLDTDEDVALYVLHQAGVATVQGSAYGASPYLRLSFAAAAPTLLEAARRIASAVEALLP